MSVKMFGLAFAARKVALRSLVALADGRVPLRLKLLAVAAAVFVVSPLNILGDVPVLGIADDAGLLLLVLMWFTRASAVHQKTIDA